MIVNNPKTDPKNVIIATAVKGIIKKLLKLK
jgi:hypothetical protein